MLIFLKTSTLCCGADCAFLSTRVTSLVVAVMFWERDDFAEVSHVGELLQKPNVTLAEIVDEPLVLQDMRASNEQLIEL